MTHLGVLQLLIDPHERYAGIGRVDPRRACNLFLDTGEPSGGLSEQNLQESALGNFAPNASMSTVGTPQRRSMFPLFDERTYTIVSSGTKGFKQAMRGGHVESESAQSPSTFARGLRLHCHALVWDACSLPNEQSALAPAVPAS